MNRLQEAENNYIRLVQQRTLNLNFSTSTIPTTEEIQSLVEGINMFLYCVSFTLILQGRLSSRAKYGTACSKT